jgi:ornithine carbamoyltransferase
MINKLLTIKDINKTDFINILNNDIKYNLKKKKSLNIGCIYEMPSTRTRISFEVALNNINMKPVKLNFEELNISRKESFQDTFTAMSCYLDGLIFRAKNHSSLVNAYKYFQKPIINALSDLSHPCQTLADLITLKEIFNSLKLNIAWFGDISNVCLSLIESMTYLPDTNLHIFTTKKISENFQNYQSENVKIYEDIISNVISNCNCIMTDVFISMSEANQMNKSKESELSKFQVNQKIMSLTKRDTVFMHCLPANINFEVTEDVLYGEQSVIWKQAKNRMVAQERILKLTNF